MRRHAGHPVFLMSTDDAALWAAQRASNASARSASVTADLADESSLVGLIDHRFKH